MVQSARHFESFEPHTLLKHAILRAYEERWARVLLARPPRTSVRIVDACAGAGQDEIGNPGSPLISIREAEKARDQLSRMRGLPVQVQVVAIEKDRVRFSKLEQLVAAFGGRHVALNGTLGDHIGGLEPDFTSIPTLFFIDPFGLDPLQADVVRRALRGSHNEVLLLFADQAALRHIGAAAAVDASDEPQGSLFGPDETHNVPAPSRELRITADAANRIMNAAFGDEQWRRVMTLAPERRRQALVDMYSDLLLRMGANRVLSLPMIGKGSRLKYHLIFATKSGKGYEVIKDAVERAWNGDLVDDRAVQLMRMGVAEPTSAIEQGVRRRFAGRRVSWTGDNPSESIRLFALQDTPAMPHQLEDLKQRLASLRIPKERSLVYDFPAAS
ncbi:MAG TPA: three-Cys-motif partner protein TcmP [Longimicrobium sp.]|nr:three-Cys-motif partner protein TcmP [Longimicrobium sp.]